MDVNEKVCFCENSNFFFFLLCVCVCGGGGGGGSKVWGRWVMWGMVDVNQE